MCFHVTTVGQTSSHFQSTRKEKLPLSVQPACITTTMGFAAMPSRSKEAFTEKQLSFQRKKKLAHFCPHIHPIKLLKL